jgi:hypothetical protein
VKLRRFTVKLKYQGAPIVSVPVEVSPEEAGNTEAIDWAHTHQHSRSSVFPHRRPSPA